MEETVEDNKNDNEEEQQAEDQQAEDEQVEAEEEEKDFIPERKDSSTEETQLEDNQSQRKGRNNSARRAASAAKLIMSYETPIGASPSDLEYVSLKKDRGTRNVRAVAKKPVNNNTGPPNHVGRPNVTDQAARQPKRIPPPAPVPLNPEEEAKKRTRAERFGLPIAPPAVPTEGEPHIQTNTRGKKRSTGGIIAATTEEDVGVSSIPSILIPLSPRSG